MNKISALLAALALSVTAQAESLVDGSAEAGQAKSITCGACHGADGNSVNPEWPSLAGQHALYSYQQLQAFKSGARVNALMLGQAMMLSDEDMRNLSVYYEGLEPAARAVADPSSVDKGRALYLGGEREKGVAACIACHGPEGTGNPAANYPSIGGQWAVYTAKQLREYADGTRANSDTAKMMGEIASRLSEDEILAVASYIQGLH